MTKTKRKAKAADSGSIKEVLAIRVETADLDRLAELTKHHPLASRGAVARETFRRGLESMETEVKRKKGLN